MAKTSDIKLFRQHLKIEQTKNDTFIVVLAIHNIKDRNHLKKVNLSNGRSIGGYEYDGLHDCYYFHCSSLFMLGSIPTTFRVSLPEAGFWSVPAPIPKAVIEKHLSESQAQDLQKFQEDNPDCTFSFAQFLDCQ